MSVKARPTATVLVLGRRQRYTVAPTANAKGRSQSHDAGVGRSYSGDHAVGTKDAASAFTSKRATPKAVSKNARFVPRGMSSPLRKSEPRQFAQSTSAAPSAT